MSKLRTFLILGRASNLPTVWSNCLAGWLLGGGGNDWSKFAVFCLGATLLYVGGMFLNDAFDVEFDRRHRRERPIPSGEILLKEVWIWGFIWLFLGVLGLVWMGKATAILAILLAGCIVAYDAIHKFTILAPFVMAACRFLLYLTAASIAYVGITGLVVWSAVALAAYIVGLSYIARTESAPGPLRYWPCIFLAIPVALALLVNDGRFRQTGCLYAAMMVIWVASSLRFIFAPRLSKNIGAAVSGLLAGIVFVDLLAVCPISTDVMGSFIILFLLAQFFQRRIPAT